MHESHAALGLLLAACPLLAANSILTGPVDGDVSAMVNSSGNLVVRGDPRDSSILIARTGTPNEYEVTGLGGSTVNGGGQALLIVTGNVDVSLGAGDDRVRLDGGISGDVDIDLGSGDDTVELRDTTLSGSALLLLGRDADSLTIQDTEIDSSTVASGPGQDTFLEVGTSVFAGGLDRFGF